jgi:FeS assembly SUF system protein
MLTKIEREVLIDQIAAELQTIYDPEIPINIFDLGLIYEIKANDYGYVVIQMTLTTPNCPAAESLPLQVQQKVEEMAEVKGIEVNIVFDPVWSTDFMTEIGKDSLEIMGLGMLVNNEDSNE